MERRLLLTGVLALAATPVLAQASPPPPTDAPAAPAPVVPNAAPAPAPAMTMAAPVTLSDASAAHVKNTMAVGSLSLAVSRIAAGKVTQPLLKQFTAFEIAEQETIADILKAMTMPGSPPRGKVKPPTDAELMGNLDADGKAAVEKMAAMKPGKAFERDYIKAQIEGHRTLLAIQEAYLKTPDSLDETNVAKLAKGMITEHLVLLSDLEKQIG